MSRKNQLTDLNDHLFAQLERLNDDDLDADGVAREAARTRAVCELAGQVVDLGRLSLAAWRAELEGGRVPPARGPLDARRLIAAAPKDREEAQ